MGKTKGPMQQEFPDGSRVRIESESVLRQFFQTWPYHHKLTSEQLNFANWVGRVELHGFYHGGDELYTVEGAPGIWHEQLLRPVEEPAPK